jgi:putative DNA primase/helicase
MASNSDFIKYSVMDAAYDFMLKNEYKLRYVPAHGCWYINNGTTWEGDDNAIISKRIVELSIEYIREIDEKIVELSAVVDRIDNNEEKKKITNTIKNLRDIQKIFSGPSFLLSMEKILMRLLTLPHGKFNADKTTINVQNGVFDFTTISLRDRSKDDFYRYVCDFEYDPAAECPVWEEIIRTTQPNEEIQKYLQKYFGYCMTGYVNEEIFMIWMGIGRNGKSTVISQPGKILGKYGRLLPSEMISNKHGSNTDTRRTIIENVRYAWCEEATISLDMEIVKQLTGITISARHMREHPYEFENTSKICVSSNRPPLLSETGTAIERRLVYIPWDVDVKDTNLWRFKENLEGLLKKERAGIFNWMVKGYRMYKDEGLKLPEILLKYQREYLDQNEILLDFISEMIIFGEPQSQIIHGDFEKMISKKSDLYMSYKKWCIAKKIDDPLTKGRFNQEIEMSLKKRDKRIYIKKRDQGYVFVGIKIKGEISDIRYSHS